MKLRSKVQILNSWILKIWNIEIECRLLRLQNKGGAVPADAHFGPQNTLLLFTLCKLTLCSSEHFAPKHILLPGSLCFLKHFAPQHILLPGTRCSLEHFAPWNNLLLCKMFSMTSFALWNTKSVLGSKVFHEAEEKNIPGSSVSGSSGPFILQRLFQKSVESGSRKVVLQTRNFFSGQPLFFNLKKARSMV